MKKHRFNWVDGLCIALALLLLAGGAWYLFSYRSMLPSDLPEKEYDITLRFDRGTTDPTDFYAVGDTLYFYGGEKEMGTITAIEPIDFMREEFSPAEGKFVVFKDLKVEQLQMTVRVKGAVDTKKNLFTVNEEALSVGLVFYPQTRKTRSIMTVLAIEEVGA